jgi:transposase
MKAHLSKRAIANFIPAFEAGMSKRALAKRYGMGMASVKKLLYEHGAGKMGAAWQTAMMSIVRPG